MPLPLARVYDLKDELGQMCSQRPQPLHLLASTIGRWLLSRVIAANGHLSWHLVQPFHVHATHLPLSTSAMPSLTASFLVGCRAAVGQTSIHFRHRLQYPRRKFSLGVPAPAMSSVVSTGTIAPVGQTSWHFWHFIQRERNSSSARAPGGRRNLSFRPKRRTKPPRPTRITACPAKTRNARRVRGELQPVLLTTGSPLLRVIPSLLTVFTILAPPHQHCVNWTKNWRPGKYAGSQFCFRSYGQSSPFPARGGGCVSLPTHDCPDGQPPTTDVGFGPPVLRLPALRPEGSEKSLLTFLLNFLNQFADQFLLHAQVANGDPGYSLVKVSLGNALDIRAEGWHPGYQVFLQEILLLCQIA